MEIIFATGNKHKMAEAKALVPSHIQLISLSDIGFEGDIDETADTIEGNSVLKAQTIFDLYKKPVIAEDTGLEVDALGGEPGVRSARYAGEHGNAEKNMQLILENLKECKHRNAQFKTVASFINSEGTLTCFEGIVRGEITQKKQGSGGFGYDPIFKPAGFKKVFAEFSEQEKNLVSHRGIAFRKFIQFLRNLDA